MLREPLHPGAAFCPTARGAINLFESREQSRSIGRLTAPARLAGTLCPVVVAQGSY